MTIASTNNVTLTALGGLLHDIGKLFFRAGLLPDDPDNVPSDHVQAGLSFARFLYGEEPAPVEILEAIAFHHGKYLAKGSPHLLQQAPTTPAAWLVYEADNIAAGIDRRDKEREQPDGEGSYPDRFDKFTPLLSAFHFLHPPERQRPELCYRLQPLRDEHFSQAIIYPQPKAAVRARPDEYRERALEIRKYIERDRNHYTTSIHSLLQLLEAMLSFVPSDTFSGHWADISLFEHLKLTSSLASCLYLYHQEQGNLKQIQRFTHWDHADEHRQIPAFLLAGGDLSGIQPFIYTIGSKGALKLLRARSFYLEILNEHMVDEILGQLGLSRTHLIYAAGGRFYLLLPNTGVTREKLAQAQQTFNRWLWRQFGGRLYLCLAAVESTALALMQDSAEPMIELSHQLSRDKQRRFAGDPDTLRELLEPYRDTGQDECQSCHADHLPLEKLDDEHWCGFCRSLHRLGKQVVGADYLVVRPGITVEGLRLPGLTGDCAMIPRDSDPQAGDLQGRDRVYGINQWLSGPHVHAQLWIGRYVPDEKAPELPDFQDLAGHSTGIHRLGVLRADVDNLGQMFKRLHHLYPELATLSRFTTITKHLNRFFKLYLSQICAGQLGKEIRGFAPDEDQAPDRRQATIVYAGGDDLFIVGAWDHVLGLAIDIQKTFQHYTDDTLSLSAGLHLFPEKFPVSQMAALAGELEEEAKKHVSADEKWTKDSLALFGQAYLKRKEDQDRYEKRCEHVYFWKELDNVMTVLREHFLPYLKLKDRVYEARDGVKFLQMSWLYRFRELLDNPDSLDLARLSYMVARARDKAQPDLSEQLNRLIAMAIRPEERRILDTAITWLIYLMRESEASALQQPILNTF